MNDEYINIATAVFSYIRDEEEFTYDKLKSMVMYKNNYANELVDMVIKFLLNNRYITISHDGACRLTRLGKKTKRGLSARITKDLINLLFNAETSLSINTYQARSAMILVILRKKAELTIEDVAEKMKESNDTIQNIEFGKSPLKIEQLIKFCYLYDASADYILGTNGFFSL